MVMILREINGFKDMFQAAENPMPMFPALAKQFLIYSFKNTNEEHAKEIILKLQHLFDIFQFSGISTNSG